MRAFEGVALDIREGTSREWRTSYVSDPSDLTSRDRDQEILDTSRKKGDDRWRKDVSGEDDELGSNGSDLTSVSLSVHNQSHPIKSPNRPRQRRAVVIEPATPSSDTQTPTKATSAVEVREDSTSSTQSLLKHHQVGHC